MKRTFSNDDQNSHNSDEIEVKSIDNSTEIRNKIPALLR